jgi:cobalt/nickel transport system permease protein
MHRSLLLAFLAAGGVIVFGVEPANAMHVSDGILPASWAIFWFAVSIPFLVLGLRNLKLRSEHDPHIKAFVGLVGAGVFVISCMPIPVPTAGTCSHPCGTGIAAILIGPALSCVVASVALFLQALFLAHGGLTTLGANIVSMGIVGSYAGYAAFVVARRLGAPWVVAAFAAGLLADWGTYGTTSLTLALALHGDTSFWTLFTSILVAFVPTQVPLGVVEGFVSAGAYTFIQSRRPEFLGRLAKGEAV